MIKRILLFTFSFIFFISKSNADNCIPNPTGGNYSASGLVNSGPGSIRQAILDANAANIGGTLTISGAVPINLFSSLPAITVDSLIIRGGTVDFNHSIVEPIFTFTTEHSCVSVDADFINVNPGTFTVTNTNDTGAGSLRDAIRKSNCSNSNDNIYFNIPGTPPHTIPLLHALPLISRSISISGSTQPANGFIGTKPKIWINGSPAITPVNGLTVYTRSTYFPPPTIDISGLMIQHCDTGIAIGYSVVTIGNSFSPNNISDCDIGVVVMRSNGAVIRNNYFGLDSSGTIAHPNNLAIGLGYDSNAVVMDNVISGNVNGISAGSGYQLTISGNKIGTDAGGMYAVPNTATGFDLGSNTGITQINGNLISGNHNTAGDCKGGYIHFNNIVQLNGNKIGTNVTGTDSIGNDEGIRLSVTTFSATNNLISGNKYGIFTYQFNGVFSNNKIGTNNLGTSALPNKYGIWMELQPQDTAIITNNLISGNEYGINGNISNGYCEISKNYIGLDNSHTFAIPNLYGITYTNVSQGRLTIGGPLAADGNYVSGNSYSGISVGCSCTPTSTIIRNNKVGITPAGGALGNNRGIGIGSTYIMVRDNTVKNNINGIQISTYDVSSKIWNNTIQDNQIGILAEGDQSYIHHNVISNNLQDGINVTGVKNTISRNQIYDNGMKGIALELSYAANDSIAPPVTAHADPTLIYGTSLPNSRIELYYNQSQNQNSQGKTLIDSVNADSLGDWTYSGSLSAPCSVTITQTDSLGNTSEFSNIEVLAEAGVDSNICTGSTLTLYALALQPGQTGLWSSPNSLSFGNDTDAHSTVYGFNVQNSYPLIWTVNNGTCTNSDTVNIFANTCLGVEDELMDLVKVYPNPAAEKIYIDVKNVMTGSIFEMRELQGREVLNISIKNKLNVIDVSKFSKGMYLCRYADERGVYIRKILLE